MNKDINLSQLKDKLNPNALITILLIVLAGALIYAGWMTFEEGDSLQNSIYSNIEEYENNRKLLKNLKKLQADSNYYLAQKEKYDEVIADAGTYNTVDYYVELTEICENYELTVKDMQIGEMAPSGNVHSATTTLSVEGDEINVKRLAEFLVSQEQIVRIDSIAMTEQQDGSVLAALSIVNFTK